MKVYQTTITVTSDERARLDEFNTLIAKNVLSGITVKFDVVELDEDEPQHEHLKDDAYDVAEGKAK